MQRRMGSEGAALGLATASMGDLELAATLAATAEELGYFTIWVADDPPGHGAGVAAAMLQATTAIRVGIGPIALDPSRAKALAARLAAGEGVPNRMAVVLEEPDSAAHPEPELRSALSQIRDALGGACTLGVSALGEQQCRFGGEVADLVFLDWMTPERITWARRHIDEGAKRRAGDLGRGPQVVGSVRVAFGPSAVACLGAEAAAYRSRARDAESFAAMGSAAVGIAAIDPPEAQVLAEPYESLLDETVIRPVATLPAAASPTLDEVFEALSVILEIAHAFAPTPELG